MCENSIDFRQGDLFPQLVLLGACPGQEEFNAVPQRPFAGRAGLNLQALLTVLRQLPNKEAYGLRPDDFASLRLEDYTLMNSHSEAKWKERNHRTLPRMREVSTVDNLDRVRSQLQFVGARVVVGLGRPVDDGNLIVRRKDSAPMRVIREVAADHRNMVFLVTGHPSQQAVNRYGGGNATQWFQAKLVRFRP